MPKRLDLLSQLGNEMKAWKRSVVFTNGCFDLIHPGHVRLLEQAKSLGRTLVVGINSDASVRGLKGEERPIIPELERQEMLMALKPVDAVLIFDEPDPLNVIMAIRPEVLVKGGDWSRDTIIGAAEVESWGGRVVVIPLEPGYSSTALIERIRSCKIAGGR